MGRAGRRTCSIRQHTSAYVSIRQHTSAYDERLCQLRIAEGRAYVSIRQHTSAYVSIRYSEPVKVEAIGISASAYVSIRTEPVKVEAIGISAVVPASDPIRIYYRHDLKHKKSS